jgi:hypothetical protein
MNARKLALTFSLAVLCSVTNLFGAEDLFLGTWKLNVARSKFAPGQAPLSGSATVKGGDGTHSATVETKIAEGQTITFSYTAKDDGTPAPVT